MDVYIFVFFLGVLFFVVLGLGLVSLGAGLLKPLYQNLADKSLLDNDDREFINKYLHQNIKSLKNFDCNMKLESGNYLFYEVIELADNHNSEVWTNREKEAWRNVIKALLMAGADPNCRNKYGVPAICKLAALPVSNSEIMALMIEYGADVNAMDRYGRTVMHYMRYDYVELLYKAGAVINARDVHGETAWFWELSTECLKKLAECGADFNIQNVLGYSSLFYERQDPERIKLLCSLGANPNLRDNEGHTPVYYNYKASCVSALRNAGCSDVWDKEGPLSTMKIGFRPDPELLLVDWLYRAVQAGILDECEDLIARGADINHLWIGDGCNWTLTDVTILHHQTHVFKWLLSKGVSCSQHAIEYADPASLLLLLENGVSCPVKYLERFLKNCTVNECISLLNRNGMAVIEDPVDKVIHFDRVDLLQVLLERGYALSDEHVQLVLKKRGTCLDILIKENSAFRERALIKAMNSGYIHIVKELVARGAALNRGTLLDAIRLNRSDMILLILEAGVKPDQRIYEEARQMMRQKSKIKILKRLKAAMSS